jgi:hypothetical protein
MAEKPIADGGTTAEKAATKALIQQKVNSTSGKERTFWQKLLQSVDNKAGQANQAFGAMTWETTRAVEEVQRVSNSFQQQIKSSKNSIVLGLSGVGQSLIQSIENAPSLIPKEITSVTKPISKAMGSTVNTATAIVKDPLGAPQYLANGMIALVDKISPKFANELDASFKSVQMDNLQHLPSKMMGSLRNLATAADALLAVPFELLSDMYNGLMEIMEAIADIIDGLISAAFNYIINEIIFAVLDSTLLTEILSFLEAVGELASFVGGIASLTGGFAMVTDITNQVSSYSSSFSSALKNPLDLALSYSPQLQQGLGFVGQVTGALRDPEKILQQYLPPELNQQLQKISQIPGLGFVGNLGYSVGDTLDKLSDGVFATALKSYEGRSSMLGPLFNQQTEPSENEFAQEDHEDKYEQGEHRPDQPVYKNAPITAVGETKKILAAAETTADGSKIEKNTAYNITETTVTDSKGKKQVVSVTGPGFSEKINPDGTVTRTVNGVTETTPN